ncbi:amino acid adenylation domain-containing protein [Streptomyces olindensis]|uniref:amino acid adenylation domain-containing protein n=1 Tax=Streptomyces olindensis TaxID=358823 RepID=UPI0033D76F10
MDSPDRTLVDSFRDTVEKFPDRIAITAEDGELTYRELSERSSEVASALQARGVRPGQVVALLMPRTTDLLVGMLGILEAGAAYLPIDPAYPSERVAWTVKDSDASLVLSTSASAETVAGRDTDVVLLDRLADEPGERTPPAVVAEGRGDRLAYVIYTSGSTGVPKGVQVEHRSVIRLFDATRERFGFDEQDVWTVFHSAAFDFSVWEIWGALSFGGRLVLVPSATARSPEAFHELLRTQHVTVLSQTPSAFRRLLAFDSLSPRRLSALRAVVLGGEKLEPATLRVWTDRYGDDSPRLVNMYGVTEATVHASYRLLTAADVGRPGVSPIGEPLSDLVFHVMDDNGQPVEEGRPGELYIEGAGLARGYLGRPELTGERFVEVPGPDGTMRRLYRTGDRVQALASGGYGYLGRVDDQLKIRGYRVEPGEIEAVLARHPEVSSSVVVSHDYGGDDLRLIAYVASTARGEELAAELGKLTATALPSHMRPSAYVVLPELPLTLNGKVDKERLPAPTAEAVSAPVRVGAGDSTASTGTERRVAEIWQTVLGLPRVEHDADFFDLGGTSLSVLRMFNHVNEAFGTDLDITVLIDGATVAVLARHLDTALHDRRTA